MKIRRANENDIDRLQAYCALHFGGSHTADLAFTRYWFYRDDEGWTINLLLDEQEEIAGVVYYIKSPARLGRQLTPLYWVSTLHVLDSYRQQGGGARLLLHTYKTLPLLGSMCGNDLSLPLSNLLGQTVAGEKIRRYIYILSHDALHFAEEDKLCALQHAFSKQKSLIQTNLSHQWSKTLPTEDGYDVVWESFSKNLTCCIERTYDYITQRYINAPFISYEILTLYDKEKLCGISVIRLQKTAKGMAARVVDFLAHPQQAAAAWHEVLKACQTKGAAFADFFVLGTYQHKNLLEAGWQIASESNELEALPNLLSPIDYRRWSYSFHLGGILLRQKPLKCSPDEAWFTKGDGDRDWPTTKLIAKYQHE